MGRATPDGGAFVTGLMADLQVKTCWQFAEQAGYARPEVTQRLLYRARWDADAVRDDVCRVLVDRFGDPDGVLINANSDLSNETF